MYDLDELCGERSLRDGLREAIGDLAIAPELRDAKIKLTSRCNLGCQMCHYWRTEREETLATGEWCRVVDELRALGCRKIHFSGGEVFLRRDFLDIVEHATGAGLKVNLTTNGTLVDKQRARRLVAARVNSVSISLDGPTARVHDRIRGRAGAFKKSLRAIRWLHRYGDDSTRGDLARRRPKVRINYVVMRDNFRKLPEMVELAGRLGAIELNPMPVDEKGERKNRLSRVQIEEYNRVIAPEVLERRRRWNFSTAADKVYPFGVTREEIAYTKRGHYARGFYEHRACLAPWLHIFLAWNGDVYLCCMSNGRMQRLGNAREQDLAAIWGGEPYRRIRAEFVAGRHLPECHRCDLFLVENARLHAALAEPRSALATAEEIRG